MVAPPPARGTITLVLGDVAGSTRLWQSHPEGMSIASRRLAAILDGLTSEHGGHRPREQGEGDNFVATFTVAVHAVSFVLALDGMLMAEPWPEGVEIAMRIAMHTGDVEWDDQTGYLGPTFNRCARLRDLGHAGMILMSQATRDIVADALPDGARIDDLGSHQLRDLSRTEHVFQLRQPGDSRQFPPLKSVSSLPNNLPVPVTSLVGRDDDIIHVARLLAKHRLVTLTGAGGSGKTRLAQHVASEVLRYAADGAWWVDLMPVTDGDRVPVAIAEAAGVTDVVGGPDASAVLAGGLRDKELLLVVDNCEHVIDAVADAVELLLERCANLRIVATSRETLDIPGEHGVRIRPLDVPDHVEPTLEQLEIAPATGLFLDRASTLDASTLDGPDRRAIAAICRRLDGMPLAIELAAARTRLLSVRAIESGLDDRFGLLTGGRRGRKPGARQRTLEASIAWSYDLLDDDERDMLCRLAVFPAAFDLDGARHVGTLGDPALAIELLTALVDKSLVTVRPAEDGRRYRLLESIRYYCLDRLRERGAADAARHAHLDHTLATIGSLGRDRDMLEEYFFAVVDIDPMLLDDIRVADDWGHESGRVDDVVDLHWPFQMTHIFHGTYHEPLTSLADLLDHPDLDVLHNARAHSLVTTYLSSLNRLAEACVVGARAIALAREVEEATGQAFLLANALTATIHARTWAGEGATELARECLDLTRGKHSLWGPGPLALVASYCSLALGFDGHEEEGFGVVTEGIAAARQAGLAHIEALSANYAVGNAVRLGRPLPEIRDLLEHARDAIPADTPRMHALLACISGVWSSMVCADPVAAKAWVDHGFAHAGPPGSGTHAVMTAARATAAWIAGDADEALTWARAASAMVAKSTNRWWQSHLAWHVAEAQTMLGDANALQAVSAARALLPREGFILTRTSIENTEARARLNHDPPTALEPSLRALELIRRHRNMGSADPVLSTLARALVAVGRLADAARVVGAAERTLAERQYTSMYTDHTQQVADACRDGLGERTFAAERDAGAALSFDQVAEWLLGSDRSRDGGRRPVTGWGSLTPTEVDVALKVAEGLSNREVAEALFVSENTVKTHLKSIYSKLDVRTRAALATQVATNSGASHPG